MTKPTIGIIGAGKLGTVLGNLAIQAGYSVYISGSGGVEKIELTIEILVPGAIPTTTEELTKHADVIILALPLSKYQQINPRTLEGKLLIDAMNYWWETDGKDEVYSDETKSSSERVQDYFSKSKVVKAFNHVGYHALVDDARIGTKENRKAVLIAGDDEATLEVVAKIVDDFGFTPLSAGALKNGVILEPTWKLFGACLSLEESRKIMEESLKTI
jgi:predicted dinucleotide-binding enzyme